MSLINLLTVGATLKGARPGSYKLDSIGALPTFGAGKTNFPSPLAAEAQPSPASNVEAPSLLSQQTQPISEVTPQPQGFLFSPAADSAALPTQSGRLTPGEASDTPVDKKTQAGRSPSIPGVGSEGTTGLPAVVSSSGAESLENAAAAPVQEAKEIKEPPKPAAPPVRPIATAKAQPRSWVKRLVNHVLFGRPTVISPAATVQTELALEKITVVRNDLHDAPERPRRGVRKTKTNPFADQAAPNPRPAAWFDLGARFGKKSPGNATAKAAAITPATATAANYVEATALLISSAEMDVRSALPAPAEVIAAAGQIEPLVSTVGRGSGRAAGAPAEAAGEPQPTLAAHL